ncbi:MAG: radical SAM protein [Candidatus Omnitrophota bacterium]|jgi:radical SAM superfamily enzyme YgiQ (UPF0313 family)
MKVDFNSNRVLLIDPPSHSWWWSVPSLGIGWIATSLEKIGFTVRIVDCQVTGGYKRKIAGLLKDYPIVGISVTNGTISSALEISGLIRENSPSTRIIFGGPHSTAIYDKLIPRYADIVVLGEGEDTIVELMREDDLSRIKGIAYWDGTLKVNPRRPFIEDLDRLGFPAWHLYDLNRYNLAYSKTPLATLITSRGCPNRCIYCTKHIHGSEARFRSLDNVLAEIDYLAGRFKVKEINLFDDGFGLDAGRVKQFCKKVIERRYKDLIFSIPNGIRADVGDYEMFKLMEKAGFYLISLGIDSGSQQVLNKINRDLSLEKANENLGMINKTRMKVKLHFMIGLPFDTAETIKETVSIAKRMLARNPCVFTASFLLALPLPQTRFYEIVERGGRFLCDLALESTNVYKGPVYEMGDLKSSDIGRMFARANRQVAIMPSFIWRNLKMGHKSLRFIPGAVKYLWDKLFHGGRLVERRA